MFGKKQSTGNTKAEPKKQEPKVDDTPVEKAEEEKPEEQVKPASQDVAETPPGYCFALDTEYFAHPLTSNGSAFCDCG